MEENIFEQRTDLSLLSNAVHAINNEIKKVIKKIAEFEQAQIPNKILAENNPFTGK